MQPLKFAFIVGSHRRVSESARIARWAQQQTALLFPDSLNYLLDLGKTPLPMWDEGVWEGEDRWKQAWTPVADQLQTSDALVVFAPEYSGMVPAALKNFFLLASSRQLGHKPGLIVAISASHNGAYPVAELRMSSYKNSRINWIPEHIILRDAAMMMKEGEVSEDADAHIRARMDYCLRLLAEYAKAARSIRESGVIDYPTFPHGM